MFRPTGSGSPFILIIALIATVGVVAAGVKLWQKYQAKDVVLVLEIAPISLPFVTDEGVLLSVTGLPRGSFTVPPNPQINHVELTAILLDGTVKPMKIKQVLLVGGNFPLDSEFELSDRYDRQITVRARVIDRMITQPGGSGSEFFYLFDNLGSNLGKSTSLIALDLDSKIVLNHLSIRQVSDRPNPWLDLKFQRSAAQPFIAPKNKRSRQILFKRIVFNPNIY